MSTLELRVGTGVTRKHPSPLTPNPLRLTDFEGGIPCLTT